MENTMESFDDMLQGKVGEDTGYTPIPAGKYIAVVAVAEMVDPVALGWQAREGATPSELADAQTPFPRLRWQIESLENGDQTEYAGRMSDQRLSLKSGVNPKTGRSFAEGRADLLRLVNGRKASEEVKGLALLGDLNLAGLSREDALAAATEALQKYIGVRGTVRVANTTNKRTGEKQDQVVKIVLPK